MNLSSHSKGAAEWGESSHIEPSSGANREHSRLHPLVPTRDEVCRRNQPLKRVAIYGSTGSIGRTSLELLAEEGNPFEVTALFAGGSSIQLFAEQVLRFQPRFAGLASEQAAREAKKLLAGKFTGQWLAGESELSAFSDSSDYDIQLAAVVGVEGLFTTLPAFQAGKVIALANKESLVCAGSVFAELRERSPTAGYIVPVDSEHSSLFRLWSAIGASNIDAYGLTASGGPFFRKTEAELHFVTVQEALSHPTWSMGPRITLDSATLMNKAFELIEACWLFGIAENTVEVRIHPQSIIHGYVRCRDGTHLYHGSAPSMSYPIAHALFFPNPAPDRVSSSVSKGNPSHENPATDGALEFIVCDEERFRALKLAREVTRSDPKKALRFYMANEIAAHAFLQNALPFSRIVEFVEHAIESLGTSVFQGSLSPSLLSPSLLSPASISPASISLASLSELPGVVEEERRLVSELLAMFKGKL